MAAYVPGEQPESQRRHQDQHQREPLPAVAGCDGGDAGGPRGAAAALPQPDEQAVPLRGGEALRRDAGDGDLLQRHGRTAADADPGVLRREPAAGLPDADLHALQRAGRDRRRRGPHRAVPGGLLAAGRRPGGDRRAAVPDRQPERPDGHVRADRRDRPAGAAGPAAARSSASTRPTWTSPATTPCGWSSSSRT